MSNIQAHRTLADLPNTLREAHWVKPGDQTLPVLDVVAIRRVEESAFKQVGSFLLMQAAGIRSAQRILDWVHAQRLTIAHFLVLAGPGNNGGDACIVAHQLAALGMHVQWVNCPGHSEPSADRQAAERLCISLLEPTEWPEEGLPLTRDTVVIDGLLGIGCTRAPEGLIARIIESVNTQIDMQQGPHQPGRARVVALDCPSGLNCSTGQAPGVAMQADLTLSYIACKTGLLDESGKDLCGDIEIDSLNCDDLLGQAHKAPALWAHSDHHMRRQLPRRQHRHHKGSYGSVAVVGGQTGMVGAALLTARAALAMGAGRVAMTLLAEHTQRSGPWALMPDIEVPGQSCFLDPLWPELMNKTLDDNLAFAQVLAVGPGLGTSAASEALLHQVLDTQAARNSGQHLVLDADALNLLAKDTGLEQALLHFQSSRAHASTTLTPHPLEAARLLACSVQDIQANRYAAAKALSKRFQATVILKGSATLVASGEDVSINLTGGPALATGGSGDVLTGAVASFLAQGLDSHEAAQCAVWLHGLSIQPFKGMEPLVVSHASQISQRMQAQLNALLRQHTR